MRYFAHLTYDGTAYHGWQIQPDAVSIQSKIQECLFTFLREKITITGCGRTDAGVHASSYYIHFDIDQKLEEEFFIYKMNAILPNDIVFYKLFPVKNNAHARYDAYHRAYVYHIHLFKSPFLNQQSYHFYQGHRLNFEKMNQAAEAIKEYSNFTTFCKSNSGLDNMECHIYESNIIYHPDSQQLEYHIAANRFLRGMVRLITGMLLNVGLSNISMDELHDALSLKKTLSKNFSVPAHGLFLNEIKYPAKIFT